MTVLVKLSTGMTANPVSMLSETVTIAGMTETHGTTGEAPELPYRLLSVNQVVAWNVARYRKRAALTQELLGELLGWTASAVSDAERSWDSGRTREFDAQLLTDIALALGVPVLALLLPPEGDGTEAHFEVRHRDGAIPVADYVEHALVPDPGDGEPADDYRDRYTAAVHRYLQPEAAAYAARWMGASRSGDELSVIAARMRERQREALEAASEWADFAAAAEAEARAKGSEGQ